MQISSFFSNSHLLISASIGNLSCRNYYCGLLIELSISFIPYTFINCNSSVRKNCIFSPKYYSFIFMCFPWIILILWIITTIPSVFSLLSNYSRFGHCEILQVSSCVLLTWSYNQPYVLGSIY